MLVAVFWISFFAAMKFLSQRFDHLLSTNHTVTHINLLSSILLPSGNFRALTQLIWFAAVLQYKKIGKDLRNYIASTYKR